MNGGEAPPRSASLLGWAGVLPFAGLSALAATGLQPPLPVAPATALVGYGAIILSFMGGAQWGLAVRSRAGLRGYAASVLPALLAWPCLALPPAPALAGLMAGFAGLLAYDLWTVRRGEAPAWYGRLRVRLTGAVLLLLAVGLAG